MKRILTASFILGLLAGCEPYDINLPGGVVTTPGSDEQPEVCSIPCQKTEICCNNACVDATGIEYCGHCGNVCLTSEICVEGKCQPEEIPTKPCDAENPCGEGLSCVLGKCIEYSGNNEECTTDCEEQLTCCGKSCVDTNTDKWNCGACNVACLDEKICVDGNCIEDPIVTEDCPNGCKDGEICCDKHCVNLNSDSLHCGQCGAFCHEDYVCKEGECVKDSVIIEECNGACTETQLCCDNICVEANSNEHCGVCNNACDEDEMCNLGTCEPTCQCPEGLHCSESGECLAYCDAEQKVECGGNKECCGEECIDIQSNPKHCGSCNNICPSQNKCSNGTCVVDCKGSPDNYECNGACVDLTNNVSHCGTCSNVCAPNNVCKGGKCVCTPTSCAALGKNCGSVDDGCGQKLNCGTCGSAFACQNNTCVQTVLPYPKRQSIKGLQPDFWGNYDEIIGNAVHGVAMNLVWETWQPTQTGSCGGGQVLYEGSCFTIEPSTAAAIKEYSSRGVVVTAVVYGVPSWARRNCSASQVVNPYFCAPTESGAKDYGKFAGFLADYFNGLNGHGRIADFVIHNEVNASEWFNYGCAKNTCDLNTWTTVYAQSYNAAYDAVMKSQSTAKVLISFEHHFGKAYDTLLSNQKPVVSAESFLASLVPKLGNRDWRIAWHAYPPDLRSNVFSANDYPRITFGNIGVLAGWLRKNYPSDPHAWEIQLTENGVNSSTPSNETKQNEAICKMFENVLGTPGIESLIYHRMRDHAAEGGLTLGLVRLDGSFKPAWSTFALANRNVSGYPKCGFETLPYIKLKRGWDGTYHWATTREFAKSSIKLEGSWKLLREKDPKNEANMRMLYECRVGGEQGNHTMISLDSGCENQFSMGPVGYAYSTEVAGSKPLYRCRVGSDHFISGASNCEGQTVEHLLGYVF